jgi:hypothetical protein
MNQYRLPLLTDRSTETLVSTTPGQDYLNKSVEVNHTPEIKGGLKVLKDKGIRITHTQNISRNDKHSNY